MHAQDQILTAAALRHVDPLMCAVNAVVSER
jgi:hypothetical protein